MIFQNTVSVTSSQFS